MASKVKNKNIYLGEYKILLEELAKLTGKSVSKLIREALGDKYGDDEDEE